VDVGDVLAGRYELLEAVGAGGMGRVLRANDRTLDRTVAVKLLAPHLLGDPDAVAALRDEAQLAASVRHANVVQVLDAVLDDTDQPAIVMEYVDGPSLREIIPADGLELDEALQVLAAVGSGLAAVHAAGLVHRDVTPGNVLLDQGQPRLTDFGIARSAAATATQTIRGSAGYLAPEQASGAPVGPAADIYALGCLATTVLTGRPPFMADAPVGVIHQHLNAVPADVRDRRPEVPAAVATTIAAALAKDPDDRPASVLAMLQSLGVPATTTAVGAATVGDGSDLPATTVIAADGDGGDLPATTVIAADGDGGGTRVLGAPSGDAPSGDTDADAAGGPRRTLIAALAAIAVLAGLAGAMWLSRDGVPQVAATPDATGTAAASPSSAPTPSPSPTASLSPQQAALAALQDLRALLVDLRGSDELSREALEKLDERAAKAVEKVQEGKPSDAAKELRELRKELADRVKEDEVSRTAEDAILAQLLEVEAALDAVPRDDGNGGNGGGPSNDTGPPSDRGSGQGDD